MTTKTTRISIPKSVIYHDNCIDGFTCRYLLHKYLKGHINWYPADYKKYIPIDEMVGTEIIIADYAIDEEDLERLIDITDQITILDHHPKTVRLMEKYQKIGIDWWFSNTKSGAMLVWEWLGANRAWSTELVKYVSDYDTWTHKYPYSKAINAYIQRLEKVYTVWEGVDFALHVNPTRIIDQGIEILKHIDQYLDSIIKTNTYIVEFHGYIVPMINIHYKYTNRVTELIGRGRYSFVIAYEVTKQGYHVSLRSHESSTVDLEMLAKRHKGGGHFHAASMILPLDYPIYSLFHIEDKVPS